MLLTIEENKLFDNKRQRDQDFKLHEYQRKSFVFSEQEIVEEIQYARSGMLSLLELIKNLLDQNSILAHLNLNQNNRIFVSLFQKHLAVIVLKIKVVAPIISFAEAFFNLDLNSNGFENDQKSCFNDFINERINLIEQFKNNPYMINDFNFDQENFNLANISSKDLHYYHMIQRLDIFFDKDYFISEQRKQQIQSKNFKPNFNALKVFLQVLRKIIEKTLILGNIIAANQLNSTKSDLRKLYCISAKLYLIDFFAWSSIFQSNKDISYQSLDDPRWQKIHDVQEVVNLGSKEQLIDSQLYFASGVAVGMAGASRSSVYSGIQKGIVSLTYSAIYYFSDNKRQDQFDFFQANPDIQTACKVWNLMEQNSVKPFIKTTLPPITSQFVIQVPRLDTIITLQNIENLPIFDQNNFENFINDQQQFLTNQNENYNQDTHVQIRFMCQQNFKIPQTKEHNKENNNNRTCGMGWQLKVQNDQKIIDALLIHVHGGGFVSMSSFSHQTYTRVWAKNITNMAVFSIDYRLSPNNQFPDQIDDVWQAYFWLINNVKSVFGINFKKVILTGDSAGGNLIIIMTLLAIQRKFRVPDSIMPCYPLTNCSKEIFVPSILNSIDDPILSMSLLNLISRAYHPKTDNRFISSQSMYMSPGPLIPDDQLKQFPKTHIICAGNDPLRDESYYFIDRLLGNGVDAKITEMEMMPHGFLNYNMKFSKMNEALPAIMKSIEILKSLIQ